ncbi:TPA: S8 family serine peptidase, partial [archaeon]|nr:S8 family serine peptidase [Candidatus Naiadarchaeales archaeon SRR2090153.bin1042]
MGRTAEIILALLIIFILSASIFSINIFAQNENSKSAKAEKIFLKSRQFVPVEKFSSQAQDEISLIAQQKGKTHALIQLDHIPSEGERKQLAEDGILLLNYIPDKAWLASVKNFNAAAQNADVTFIDSLNAQDKIDPDLLSFGIPNYTKNSDGTANFSVMFFDDANDAEVENILKNYAINYEPPLVGDVWKIVLPENKLNDFATEDIVQWVEAIPAPLAVSNNASRAGAGVNTVQTSPYNLNGSVVTLAEWDSGYGNHVDFNSRKTQGDQGGSTTSHSTHVAGTMLGDGANSINQSGAAAQWRGMATNATYITYEWPDSGSNELYNESNLSVVSEAVLSQNSWAYNTAGSCSLEGKYDSFTQAYDNIIYGNSSVIAGGKELIVVFAAGNERSNITGCLGTPGGADNDGYGSVPGPGGTAKNVITVGAISNYFWPDPEVWPNNLYFPSWGPTRDGRLKPEIVAHGDAVTSTESTSNQYGVKTGTSMAAPGVSGTIGLMMQAYRNTHSNQSFKPATAKIILVQSARDLNNTGPDFATGYGLINATKAIDLILRDNSTNATDVIHENNITNNANRTFNVRVPEGQSEFRVTLAWDDVL